MAIEERVVLADRTLMCSRCKWYGEPEFRDRSSTEGPMIAAYCPCCGRWIKWVRILDEGKDRGHLRTTIVRLVLRLNRTEDLDAVQTAISNRRFELGLNDTTRGNHPA